MSKRRPTAADQVAAIARGGIDALRAAEALVAGGRDGQIQLRVAVTRKKAYQAAARAAGKTLSAWLISIADAAL